MGSGMLPIPPPGWGAVERAIYELSKAMQAQGVETAIVNSDGTGRSIQEYRFAMGLPGRLKGRDWDVLHAATPVVGSVLSFRKEPYFYTSHSRHWFGTAGLGERWGLMLERKAARNSLRTIALTKEAAAKMMEGRKGVPKERIRVIPNGVDTDHFKPDWERRAGHNILCVGAVHPRKRWHLAVMAASKVKGTHLTIVGPIQDEAYAGRLRSLAPKTSLSLPGEVKEQELVRSYAESDIFLMPSNSELMSLAVMEAMSSGLPVVGTSILEEMVDDEKSGYLVSSGLEEQGTVDAMAEGIEELLGDGTKRRVYGETARSHALDNWGWSSVARKTLEVYREVLK